PRARVLGSPPPQRRGGVRRAARPGPQPTATPLPRPPASHGPRAALEGPPRRRATRRAPRGLDGLRPAALARARRAHRAARADEQAVTITLLGGKTITVPLQVPAGTPLDKVRLPGIDTPIIAITPPGQTVQKPSETAKQVLDDVLGHKRHKHHKRRHARRHA